MNALLNLALLLLATTQALAQTALAPPATDPLAQAKSLLRENSLPAAEAALRAEIAANPKSPDARYLLGLVLHRENKPKDSLAAYTQAAAITPPHSEDLRIVALDYVLLDDYPDAIHWLERSLAADPRNAEAWYALGRAYYTQQRFGEAADSFRKTLSHAPGSVKAQNNLGLALDGLNRTEEAMEAYRAAIQPKTNSSGAGNLGSEQPRLNLAIDLIHRDRLSEALPLLKEAAAISPSDPKIYEQLGHLYLQQGRLPEAQSSLSRAVELSPGSPALHFLLGQVYRRQGLDEEAKTEFARSAQLSGTHSSDKE